MRSATALVLLWGLLVGSIAARAGSGSTLIDQPKNCFKGMTAERVCAVFAPSNLKIHLGENILFIRKKTSLLFWGWGRFELLSGEVLVQKKSRGLLEVKFFQEALQIESGELLLTRTSQQGPIEVVNLRAQMTFSGRWTANQVLPPGYQNWYAPGLQQPGYGVPRVYNAEAIFRKVTALWVGSTKDVVEVLKSYGELRRTAQVAAAESYQSLVRRHFASVEEDRLQEERRSRALQDEKEKLRRLYRARVLDGEYTQPFD